MMTISAKANHSAWMKILFFIPLCVLTFFVLMQYEAVCNFGGTLQAPFSLKTAVDDWIPFSIYIIYPYILCLFYLPFSGIAYAFNRNISVVQMVSFYVSAVLIWLSCYAIYLMFPTTAESVMLYSYSPQIGNQGIFQALHELYTSSTPLGDFPSLHVAPMVFMSIFLYKNWRSFFWIFLGFAILGAAGTIILKFHTLVGVMGGVAMGVIGYFAFYEKFTLKYFSKFASTRNT
jgi:membrane-associated phospholipid phosphatase